VSAVFSLAWVTSTAGESTAISFRRTSQSRLSNLRFRLSDVSVVDRKKTYNRGHIVYKRHSARYVDPQRVTTSCVRLRDATSSGTTICDSANACTGKFSRSGWCPADDPGTAVPPCSGSSSAHARRGRPKDRCGMPVVRPSHRNHPQRV